MGHVALAGALEEPGEDRNGVGVIADTSEGDGLLVDVGQGYGPRSGSHSLRKTRRAISATSRENADSRRMGSWGASHDGLLANGALHASIGMIDAFDPSDTKTLLLLVQYVTMRYRLPS